MGREVLQTLNCRRSSVKSGHGWLRNLQAFCIIESCRVSHFMSALVIGIVRTQSVCSLEIVLNIDGGDDSVVIWNWLGAVEIWQKSLDLWYWISKSYPSRMIADRWGRQAEYTFFAPNIASNSLWYARSVKWRPNSIL